MCPRCLACLLELQAGKHIIYGTAYSYHNLCLKVWNGFHFSRPVISQSKWRKDIDSFVKCILRLFTGDRLQIRCKLFPKLRRPFLSPALVAYWAYKSNQETSFCLHSPRMATSKPKEISAEGVNRVTHVRNEIGDLQGELQPLWQARDNWITI